MGVNVQINPALWSRMHRDRGMPGATKPGESGLENKADPRDPDKRRATRPGQDSDRQDGNRTRDPAQPDQGDQSTAGLHDGFHGVARTDLILDDQILRERMVILPASGARDPGSLRGRDNQPENDPSDKKPSNNNPSSHDSSRNGDAHQPAQPNDGSMLQSGLENATQCLAFISFDEDDDSYTIVLMNSRDGEIYKESGRYDAGSNRIVFDGNMRDDADRPGRTGAGAGEQPSSTRREPGSMNTRATRAQHEVRVELELRGDDSYEVTMYQGSAAGSGVGDPNSAPDQRTGQQPYTTKSADARGNIVYRATYTRADASQEGLYQRMLDAEDSSSRTSWREPHKSE
ncbi:MAG: hypothetical protein IPJ41_12010 [Phycisphaerales bacterium]|nr:hypothetical protein [Phycisphaerales bacterium]